MANTVKTVDSLKSMTIILDGKTVEEVAVSNPCQMWRTVDSYFEKHGNEARIMVMRQDGTLFKVWTRKQLKDGTWIKTNSVKETNRGYQLSLKKKAAEAAAKVAEA